MKEKHTNWENDFRENTRPRKTNKIKPKGTETKKSGIKPQLNSSINLLFVCSRNQWRSPTAEKIYRNKPMIHVRSAGTSPNARRCISSADIHWADIIFVMENKHKSIILDDFANETENKKIVVMGIEDIYQYMDEELIEEITYCVEGVIYDLK